MLTNPLTATSRSQPLANDDDNLLSILSMSNPPASSDHYASATRTLVWMVTRATDWSRASSDHREQPHLMINLHRTGAISATPLATVGIHNAISVQGHSPESAG
jgi:hypothetical protein